MCGVFVLFLLEPEDLVRGCGFFVSKRAFVVDFLIGSGGFCFNRNFWLAHLFSVCAVGEDREVHSFFLQLDLFRLLFDRSFYIFSRKHRFTSIPFI